MTTHKSLKRAVRARMAKTGERYASARRAVLREPGGGTRHGDAAAPMTAAAAGLGIHPETWALARALADAGMTAEPGGRPLSEAMILGIGGGLGAGYILWEFKARGGAILTLGFQNRWQYPGIPGWTGTTLERLGVPADLHETAGARSARDALDRALDDGATVVVAIDLQSLGVWNQPATLSGYCGGPVIVTGRADRDTYLVGDRGAAALHVPAATLAAARARIGSYKHRLIRVRPPARPLPENALRDAILAGLADQVEHLGSPSDSFSLPAWRKWSRMMTDTRNAKAWPRVFAGGRGLFGALVSIVEGVDGDAGATGGHLRELYAEFLDEAAPLTGLAGLADAASGWRAAADLWDDLADAAIPPALVDGIEAVEAAERLNAAVRRGEPGRAAATAAARELWGIRDRHGDAFPLDQAATDDLLANIGERLAAIHDAERAALAATAAAIGR